MPPHSAAERGQAMECFVSLGAQTNPPTGRNTVSRKDIGERADFVSKRDHAVELRQAAQRFVRENSRRSVWMTVPATANRCATMSS